MTEQPDDSTTKADAPAPTTSLNESRFMFVDVAALRAKQLRRGAVPRLGADYYHDSPHKLERVAMEEVRKGLVEFSVPVWTRPTPPEAP